MKNIPVECPYCGVQTFADDKGRVASHVKLAVQAGQKDAACVQQRNAKDFRRKAERKEAAAYRRETERRRGLEAETTLPPHLR